MTARDQLQDQVRSSDHEADHEAGQAGPGPSHGASPGAGGRSILLDQIEIRQPCSMDWKQMAGDEQVRFCRDCSMNVYDISAMTAEAAEALILKHEGPNGGGLCARMYVRTDGKVVTADCVKIRFGRTRKMVRRVATMVAVLFLGTAGALFGAAFGIRKADEIGSNSGRSGPWIFSQPAQQRLIMGKICVPAPVPLPNPVPNANSIVGPGGVTVPNSSAAAADGLEVNPPAQTPRPQPNKS